jgi:hypothetical protein
MYLLICFSFNECHYLRLHCICEIWGLQGGDYKYGWLLQCVAVHSDKTVPKYQKYTLSIIKIANSYSKYNIWVIKIYSEGRSSRFLWILGTITPDYTASHSRAIAVRFYNERIINYYLTVKYADDIGGVIVLEWLRKYNKNLQSYEMVIRIAGRALSSEGRTT